MTLGITGRQGLNFAVAIDHARDILEGRETPRRRRRPARRHRVRQLGRRQRERSPAAAGRTGVPAPRRLAEQAATQLDRRGSASAASATPSRLAARSIANGSRCCRPAPSPATRPPGASTTSSRCRREMNSSAIHAGVAQDARRAEVLPGDDSRHAASRTRLQFEGWDPDPSLIRT